MIHNWMRIIGTTLVLLAMTFTTVALTGCEREPDNGVLIEGDNGVDVDVDAPGDD